MNLWTCYEEIRRKKSLYFLGMTIMRTIMLFDLCIAIFRSRYTIMCTCFVVLYSYFFRNWFIALHTFIGFWWCILLLIALSVCHVFNNLLTYLLTYVLEVAAKDRGQVSIQRTQGNARHLRIFWRNWRRRREETTQASTPRTQQTPATQRSDSERKDRSGVCYCVAFFAYACFVAFAELRALRWMLTSK